MKPIYILKKTARNLKNEIRWYRYFKGSSIGGSRGGYPKSLLWMYRNGFCQEQAISCDISDSNKKSYLRDKDYRRCHPVNGTYSSIIDNKLYLPYLFKDYPSFVPEYYFRIHKGHFKSLDRRLGSDDVRQIESLLEEKGMLAVKAVSSSLGEGFAVLESKEGRIYINRAPIDAGGFGKYLAALDDSVITEYVVQHEYSGRINPSCANSIRLLCLRPTESDKFVLARSFHRFGVNDNIVDNLGSSSGILCHIDIGSGTLKDCGLVKNRGDIVRKVAISSHPQSGAQIAGIRIPGWDAVVGKLLEIFNTFPFLKYIGVDIVITNDGFKVLEVNSLSTLLVFQAEMPIFEDPLLGPFFRTLLAEKK